MPRTHRSTPDSLDRNVPGRGRLRIQPYLVRLDESPASEPHGRVGTVSSSRVDRHELSRIR